MCCVSVISRPTLAFVFYSYKLPKPSVGALLSNNRKDMNAEENSLEKFPEKARNWFVSDLCHYRLKSYQIINILPFKTKVNKARFFINWRENLKRTEDTFRKRFDLYVNYASWLVVVVVQSENRKCRKLELFFSFKLHHKYYGALIVKISEFKKFELLFLPSLKIFSKIFSCFSHQQHFVCRVHSTYNQRTPNFQGHVYLVLWVPKFQHINNC